MGYIWTFISALIIFVSSALADSTLFVGTEYHPLQRADSSAPTNAFTTEVSFRIERDNATGQEWSEAFGQVLRVRDSLGTSVIIDSVALYFTKSLGYFGRDGYMVAKKLFKAPVKDDATWNQWDKTNAYEWATAGARCEDDAGQDNTSDGGVCGTTTADRKATIFDSVYVFNDLGTQTFRIAMMASDTSDDGNFRYSLQAHQNLKYTFHNDEAAGDNSPYRPKAYVHWHTAPSTGIVADPALHDNEAGAVLHSGSHGRTLHGP